MEKQFKIIAKTNPYIAQRDGQFKGRVQYVVQENMSLEDAQKELERMADSDYENEGGCDLSFHSKDLGSYEYDSRYYSIEEMETLTFSIKKHQFIPSGEKVEVTNETRDFGHGEQVKVIYSDGSEGWEHTEDLTD